ncbi:DMT family transporter [Pseudoteredinibacter isoporae]|uniref:DMT family transporter n=1 Tax=Pseudoteredinibacter isoporae TaxID=570281 RepID=UPI00310534E2
MIRLNTIVLLMIWLFLTASSFVVAEQLLPYANPIASTAIRFALAALLMLLCVRGKYLSILSGALALQYFLVSVLLVLFFLGLFVALETTTAVKTSVIYTLLPLMTVLLNAVVASVRASVFQCLGFVLGSAGALWLLFDLNRKDFANWTWVSGDGVFLMACASLALHVVLLKRWFAGRPPAQSVFTILVFGSFLLLPGFIFWGESETIQWQEFGFWWPLLYLTGFTTLGTFFLQQKLLQRLCANDLLATSYLSPAIVVGLTASSWFLQGSNGIWGIALTLLGMGLIFQGRPAENPSKSLAKMRH